MAEVEWAGWLENFAGIMNFVIFPMFFLSSALYPLRRLRDSSPLLADIAQANPFTHAVETIRFALAGQVNWLSLAVSVGALVDCVTVAIMGYNPVRGTLSRKAGAPA